ncbi:hypothetical protein [Pseudomonas matsuisoli]|uniref:Uncharacterized protein n=1 Tax=Pseudomonas matsuisoli TaxID=1515666 RepID=A0A917PT51_9PSED|nr:hypothetical protein [Pseudomonas matsuisoli]GGJ90281.1 hypothetical protein GCM10009304_14900 [Pseudomonas matsuisoli]
MTTPIDIDHAMNVASQAFLPYGCVTSANPEDDSFGFSVVDSGGEPVLDVPRVGRLQYEDPTRLSGVLTQARQDLEKKGFELQEWTMPFIVDPQGIPETPPNY